MRERICMMVILHRFRTKEQKIFVVLRGEAYKVTKGREDNW
jgi:hypothetical protein